MTPPPSWSDVAREAVPAVRARADEVEKARRLPPDLVADLADLGLFRLWLPCDLGGEGGDFRAGLEAVEEISRGDGSAGWVVMIGMSTAVVAGYLQPDVAQEVYGSEPATVTGGVVAPNGRATPVEGGYLVSGRWPFASGCEHCSWLVGGSLVQRRGSRDEQPPEAPEWRLMLFPAADVEIIDTWDVVGLRGTGSHDIAVEEVFVPEARSLTFPAAAALRPEPYYRVAIPSPLGLALAAVSLGIARGAIDDVVELAALKTPALSTNPLAKRAIVQIEVAQADVELRAARALLLHCAAELWSTGQGAIAVSARQRAEARAAAIHAVATAASVTDRAYTLAGGTSLRMESPLQRRLRDVHAATQHAMTSRAILEPIGRVLLGLPTDTAAL